MNGAKRTIVVAVVAALSIAGCNYYGEGVLRPVGGPLAEQSHPPTLMVKMQKARGARTMTTTLPDGEVCRGEYVYVRSGTDHQRASGGPRADLQSVWIDLYGAGYFEKHVRPRRRVEAVLMGVRNTTLKLDMCPGCEPLSPFNEDLYDGVAIDSLGNVYKVRF
jgi:hypothetical protein